MKKKIYISGKITGLVYSEVQKKFNRAENLIKIMDHEAINPLKITPFVDGKTWKEYMIDDLKALLDCDAIALLPDWKDSKGACVEYQLAKSLELEIIELDF